MPVTKPHSSRSHIAHRYIETQMNIHRQPLLMLMNTINKFEQPNTEQADRRCAFSRSFTRMFDRLCAFLDERIGGASELIDACQSVADRFWHSKLYFPVCFLMLAVFMAVGQPVIGGVLVMSTLIFLLLFCDDLLSILFPVVLLAMVGTEFYDELYSLLRFWWIGLLAAAALLVHIGAYARAPRNGGCMHGLVAVSVATLLGGLGFISREEYFSPTALYYSLGLGVVMLLIYLLLRSEADRPRDYDIAERTPNFPNPSAEKSTFSDTSYSTITSGQ